MTTIVDCLFIALFGIVIISRFDFNYFVQFFNCPTMQPKAGRKENKVNITISSERIVVCGGKWNGHGKGECC